MRNKNSLILAFSIALFVSANLLVSPGHATASPQPAPGEAAPIRYVVQPGDTLHAISLRFGSSVQAIVEANGIQNPDLIWSGQSLVIPSFPESTRPVSNVAGSSQTENTTSPSSTQPSNTTIQNIPTPPMVTMNDRETAMLEGINMQRANVGLPRLRFEPSLLAIARARSNDMASRGYFSHTTPEGSRIQDLARAAGLRQSVISEILARNNYPAEKSVEVSIAAFMRSDNHRAHILNPIYVGAAVAEARASDGMQYYTVALSSD